MVMLFSSCGKEKSQNTQLNEEHQILQALNKGDYEGALSIIKRLPQEKRKTKETLYWKTQALSLRAGIDIYSLFPIMKMKLFDVAMDEWSSINKYSKRQQGRLSSTILGDGGGMSSVEELNKTKEEVKNIPLEDIEYETSFELIYQIENHLNQVSSKNENTFSCQWSYLLKSKIFPKGQSYRSLYFAYNISGGCDSLILEEYLEGIYFPPLVKKYALLLIGEQIKSILSRKDKGKFLKGIFALFESVPILQKMPSLDYQKTGDIYEALKILKSIKEMTSKDERIGMNARKQMGLISGFLIAGSLKNAIDFDQVNSPLDIVCQANPRLLAKHYPYLRNGVLYLAESVEDSDLSKKQIKDIKFLKKKLGEAPEKLNEKKKQRLIQKIQDFINTNC